MFHRAAHSAFVSKERDIFALTTDATGRFVVSADTGGVVNIWDLSIARLSVVLCGDTSQSSLFSFCSEFPHPIRTIYEQFGQHEKEESQLSKVALSADGKNLITASSGRQSVVKLWQWSSCDASADRQSGEMRVVSGMQIFRHIQFQTYSSCLRSLIMSRASGSAATQTMLRFSS